jgi:inner membrane transporter RhtA
VIPYICDQFAMSRLPRATFTLLLARLPTMATLIGAVVLAQVPSLGDLACIAPVMGGVAIRQPPAE